MNNEERNAFVERRYDELRMEGKHGHYECLFRVVHEIVDAELARVREERDKAISEVGMWARVAGTAEAKIERVARRAAEIVNNEMPAVERLDEPDLEEAVAQAMREEG